MREGVKGISKFMTSDHPYQILSLDLKVLSLLWQDLQLLTHVMSCGESFNYLCIFNFVFEKDRLEYEYDVLWWSWWCLTSTSTWWWSWWWRTLMPLRWVSPLTAKWPLLVRRRSWHKCHFPFRSPFTQWYFMTARRILCVVCVNNWTLMTKTSLSQCNPHGCQGKPVQEKWGLLFSLSSCSFSDLSWPHTTLFHSRRPQLTQDLIWEDGKMASIGFHHLREIAFSPRDHFPAFVLTRLTII